MRNTEMTTIQLNTGRSGPICDAALALAHEEGTEVVCLQEPWVGEKDGHVLTKSHPVYQKYLPLGRGTPKVIKYVLKGTRATEKDLDTNTAVRTTVRGVEIFNVYRESKDTDTPRTIRSLAKGRNRQLVLGDFNAAHANWQIGRPANTAGQELATCAELRGFDCWITDTPTHDKGNVLDLAFAAGLTGTAAIEQNWELGSDHRPLRVTVCNLQARKTDRWKTILVADHKLEDFGRTSKKLEQTPLISSPPPI